MQNFRTVIENSLDGISLLDADGITLYDSPSIVRLLGYSNSELLGTNAFDLIHPDDLEANKSLFGKLIQEPGHREVATLRYRHKDGSWVWLEVIATNHLADPDIQAVILNYHDVTERKQAEASLQESEERFRQVFENASIALIVLDDDGNYIEVNHEAVELTGYSADELLGMSLPALTPPELQDKTWKAFAEATRNRKSEGETFIRRKDHTVVPVHYSASRVGPGRYLASFRDLSAQKIAEEAARQATGFAQEVIASVEEGIVVHHRNEYYNVWNKYMEQLTGYTSEEMKGKSPPDVFPYLRPHNIPELLQKALRGEIVSLPDIRFDLPRTGKSGWFAARFAPLRDANKDIIGTIVTIHDITERKQTQERLAALSRELINAQEAERRRMARELHDEIGQVLTAINLHLHSARKLAGAAALHTIDEGIQTVNTALGRVRDMSLALRPSVLDDLGLEAALRWLLNQQVQKHGLDVYFESDLGDKRLSPEVESACFRIGQHALTNVARHARASRVEMELRLSKTGLTMMIRDDGVGFDKTVTVKRAIQGTTFGLLGMIERAQLLGGTLEIDSEPGQGTRIEVYFPLAAGK